MTRGGLRKPGPGKSLGRPALGKTKKVRKSITLRPDHIARMKGEKASTVIETALDQFFEKLDQITDLI